MNETVDVILKRRSHRTFRDQDISPEDREIILNSIMRAPTAGNMMLYTILEVEEQADKEILVKTCDNQPFIAKSPFVLIFLADLQRWYDYFHFSGVDNIVPPSEADLLLAASDANIAAQNGVIAAEALGIGSCYVGDIMENIEVHREMFNLPGMVFPVAMLCFGYKKAEKGKKSLTPRFKQEYIHHKGSYKRFSKDEFNDMFSHYNIKNFIEGAENIGQHYYIRKTNSSYMAEMRRSVKEGIKDWLDPKITR